jgi:hypothetical protein
MDVDREAVLDDETSGKLFFPFISGSLLQFGSMICLTRPKMKKGNEAITDLVEMKVESLLLKQGQRFLLPIWTMVYQKMI